MFPDWINRVAEEAHAIAMSMLHKKGRGAVLVGAVRVDTALEALLKAALAPPSSRETLFQPNRPLGLIDPAVEWAMPATSSGWLRATTRPAPTRSGHRWRYPILAVARTKAVHFPLHRPLAL